MDEAFFARCMRCWRTCLPCLAALLWPIADACQAGTLTLAWDKSPDLRVVGYKVHYGTASGQYSTTVDAGSSTTATPRLDEGYRYFFAITAYDASGLGSDYSNEISVARLIQPTGSADPKASFTVDRSIGNAPLSVEFSSTTSGTVTSYQWDFGDGAVESVIASEAPGRTTRHTYVTPGTYTVSLVVKGPTGSDAITKPGLIAATRSTKPTVILPHPLLPPGR